MSALVFNYDVNVINIENKTLNIANHGTQSVSTSEYIHRKYTL